MQLKYYLQVLRNGKMFVHKTVLSMVVNESTIKITKEQYDYLRTLENVDYMCVDSAFLIG